MDPKKLKEILEKHKRWLRDHEDGKRANLRYANLRYADLRSANLEGANLRYANLEGANLRSANLEGANLRYAKIDYIKEDLFKVLAVAKNEVPKLYEAIMNGKINGRVYDGECACLVGTIANIRHENYLSLNIDLSPDSSRPIEQWVFGIKQGDTPQNNVISKITAEWVREFMDKEGIKYTKRR